MLFCIRQKHQTALPTSLELRKRFLFGYNITILCVHVKHVGTVDLGCSITARTFNDLGLL